MNEQIERRIKEASNQGLLLAATLVLVAVYILTGERRSYSHTFDLSTLPLILGERIKDSQGILVTCTLIQKDRAMDVTDEQLSRIKK